MTVKMAITYFVLISDGAFTISLNDEILDPISVERLSFRKRFRLRLFRMEEQ